MTNEYLLTDVLECIWAFFYLNSLTSSIRSWSLFLFVRILLTDANFELPNFFASLRFQDLSREPRGQTNRETS